MKFSEKLQTLRKENKLSQEKLADMLDVSRQAVSKWESGQTYPEMDKLLTMCKIFECSLDELTNDDITEIGKDNKNKNSSSNLVDEVLEIINRTCKIFRKIRFKDVFKILFEMFIVFIILLVLSLPIQYIYSLGREVFMNFGYQIGNILSSVFKFILGVSYFILSIIIFVYVYKIRVLDHYEKLCDELESDKVESPQAAKTKVIINNDNSNSSMKRGNVIKKEHNYTIFKKLGSIVMALIKFFILCMSIPFIFTLLFLFASLIISIIVIFRGVFFGGVILGILACILLNIAILELVFNFIFNKKNSIKRLFIMLIVAISSLGIAIGITMWDVANINYIEEVPANMEKETYNITYEMHEDTVILDQYYDNVYYNIDDSLGNKIKIEITYYKDYNRVFTSYHDNKYITFHYSTNTQSINDTIDLVLSDLSKRQIHLYEGLYSLDMNIYASAKTIDKLEINKTKYLNDEAQRQYNEQIEYYSSQIEAYDERIQKLEEEYNHKIDKLETEKQNLIDKNQQLQDKINEYELKIKEYRDSINEILEN